MGFLGATFRTDGEGDVSFEDATFRTDGEGDVWFGGATFQADGEGGVTFYGAMLLNADFRSVKFGEANFGGVDFIGTDLREANLARISVNGATTCERLNEGNRDDKSTGRFLILTPLRRLFKESEFDSPSVAKDKLPQRRDTKARAWDAKAQAWDATARAYHQLKTTFSEHGLVGKARKMHVRERRARSLEVRAANGWFDSRHLRSLPSRVVTGYGVQYEYLAFWMGMLFLSSTAVYVTAGVRDTLATNIAYSVLAFTAAPPGIPSGMGVGVLLVMMVETFFGTLSIVLLGYILGNRERF